MPWTLRRDVNEFMAEAGQLLTEDPQRNTVVLTVVAQDQAGAQSGTWYAWWTDPTGAVRGAASLTAPYPVLVDVLPMESVPELIDAVVEQTGAFPGINGPVEIAVEIAAIAAARTKQVATLLHSTRLFRLAELIAPDPLPVGVGRRAEIADLDLVVEWGLAFETEIGGPRAGRLRELLERKIEWGGFELWVDEDGQPVSLAGSSLPTFGVARVGPVYTPPQHRKKGYGGAVTWLVADRLVSQGHGVVLFTDLSNPTTNALYPRLGFVPVADRAIFLMTPSTV